MPEIRIVAEMLFKPGQKKELAPALEKLVAGSRAESGNISYEVLESLDNPDHVFVVENWASQSAIDEHNQTPHFQEFMKLAAERAEKSQVTLLKKAL